MEKEYLIRKRPVSALLIFALPMMLGNFFQQAYTMADSVIVGRFVGEEALAAVGASVITSQTFGSRDYSRMKRSVSTALLSFLAISLVLGAGGLLFSRQIMVLLRTPENILQDASTYLNIYFLGLPFLFMYNVLSSMFNALGRSRIPLYLLIFSSVLNVALDIYMVTALSMGVAGVAWATLIAQGISAVLSFVIFLRGLKSYPGKLDRLFDGRELKNMARVALPSILQQSTVSIGMMLVQSVVNSFGSQMLAGYSAAMRIESVCIVPMSAMGNAISSYTAQNIGAGKPERVRAGYRASYGIVFAIAAVICLAVQLLARPLVSLFMEEGGSSLAFETGMACTRFMGWFYVLIGLKMISDGVLRGAGDMTMFTVANLVNLGLRVVLAVTLAPQFGIQFVWMAVPVGWLINYGISFLEYRTGKWEQPRGIRSQTP